MAAADPQLQQVVLLAQAGRTEEALRLLDRLAESGHAAALVNLADFYWLGGPVRQDPALGRDYYRRASDAGHPRARIIYTNLLATGVYGDRDWPTALSRLRQEALTDPRRARILAAIEAMDLDDEGDPRAPPAGRNVSSFVDATLFPGLFTEAECDLLLEAAEPGYEPSTIHDGRGGHVPHPLRTSDGAPLHWLIEDPAIHALNRRLAAVTGTKPEQAEPLLILRYRPGQQYRRHFDALPGLENQRVKTALAYLNDGYEGGETEFPKAGLKVKGAKGDVLVFRNTGPDGRPEPFSEHAGLPVASGVKYLASRWIRERRHVPAA